MSSTSKELIFNPEFIFSTMKMWRKEFDKYEQSSMIHYKRIRSYLTLWQFRLSEDTKCEIREKLAEHLDEITDHDYVQDLDSYLEGFCFQFDKSVLEETKSPKVVSKITSQNDPEPLQSMNDGSNFTESETDNSFTSDNDSLDFYTQQFFQ